MKRRACAALACLVLLATLPAYAAGPAELTVSGVGTVMQPPDLAVVDATVETNSPNSSDAVSENSVRYDHVVTALTRLGIARTDVIFSGYNVSYAPKPKIVPVNDEQRYGYTVTRSFSVKVRHIAMAGQVVDACTSSGATNINNVSFTIGNPAAARDRAIALAVANARDMANKVASAAGLRIVAVKSMDLGGGPVLPQPLMMGRALPAAPPTPTELDQSNVTITVNINAVFLAEP